MSAHSNIILIDDDPMFNFIHSKVIQTTKLDFVVRAFDWARDALAELNQIAQSDISDFHCIIFLDINMPEIDGWAFLERFSKLSPSLVSACTVFMLSSSKDISDIEKSRTYPVVSGFISKPLTVQQLLKISGEHHA